MEQRRGIFQYSVLLIIAGIAINFIFAKLALFMEVPLFLDSIGTILASVLGGYLPGITVGFLSNVLNSLSDSITLYYGIISILIALTAAFLASKGWFARLSKALIAVLIFAFIGGIIGSVLTWLLFGFSFGSGISAPYAILLHDTYGFSEFNAQLTADIVLDVTDKFITVFICFFTIKMLPISLKNRFSDFSARHRDKNSDYSKRYFTVKHSLRSKVVMMIAATALILGCLATSISYILYSNAMTDHYIDTASSMTKIEMNAINADSINKYLDTKEKDSEYLATESYLQELRDTAADIEYIYVYQIREDGCHVVFDIDTPDLPGEELGTVIPIESDFLEYKENLLAGEKIPPIISNDSYGWLLTIYEPIFDSSGKCVAYAAADVAMDDIMTDRAVFIIKVIALMFGATILIVAFALWFAEHYLVEPINAMAKAADEFAYDSKAERVETTKNIDGLNIKTGDEIENLYRALKKTVTDVSNYISDINEKNETITQMQNNIIISFADMVENRDLNTGEHIKRTAAYVKIIASEMLREGSYSEIIDQDYVDDIVRCAPLHDLGKIRISDTILNKPGKLTPEEFDEIKTHTTAGKKIIEEVICNIRDMSYFTEAENMAEYHHERWDGKGYPNGLSGTQIPLSARIMAVADVYDALISKRSYKKAMTDEEAEEIIRLESGTHFDPVVVEAFLNAKEEINAAVY